MKKNKNILEKVVAKVQKELSLQKKNNKFVNYYQSCIKDQIGFVLVMNFVFIY